MGNILSYFFPPSQPSIEQVLEEAQVEEVKEENIPESPKVSVENENNVSDSVVDDSIPDSDKQFETLEKVSDGTVDDGFEVVEEVKCTDISYEEEKTVACEETTLVPNLIEETEEDVSAITIEATDVVPQMVENTKDVEVIGSIIDEVEVQTPDNIPSEAIKESSPEVEEVTATKEAEVKSATPEPEPSTREVEVKSATPEPEPATEEAKEKSVTPEPEPQLPTTETPTEETKTSTNISEILTPSNVEPLEGDTDIEIIGSIDETEIEESDIKEDNDNEEKPLPPPIVEVAVAEKAKEWTCTYPIDQSNNAPNQVPVTDIVEKLAPSERLLDNVTDEATAENPTLEEDLTTSQNNTNTTPEVTEEKVSNSESNDSPATNIQQTDEKSEKIPDIDNDTILKPDEETKKEVSGGGAAGLRDLLESSTED